MKRVTKIRSRRSECIERHTTTIFSEGPRIVQVLSLRPIKEIRKSLLFALYIIYIKSILVIFQNALFSSLLRRFLMGVTQFAVQEYVTLVFR